MTKYTFVPSKLQTTGSTPISSSSSSSSQIINGVTIEQQQQQQQRKRQKQQHQLEHNVSTALFVDINNTPSQNGNIVNNIAENTIDMENRDNCPDKSKDKNDTRLYHHQDGNTMTYRNHYRSELKELESLQHYCDSILMEIDNIIREITTALKTTSTVAETTRAETAISSSFRAPKDHYISQSIGIINEKLIAFSSVFTKICVLVQQNFVIKRVPIRIIQTWIKTIELYEHRITRLMETVERIKTVVCARAQKHLAILKNNASQYIL
jgi:hypothetical protein